MRTRPATIVTGGSRGIGAATVRALAAAGHDVVLGYRRDAAAAEQVVAQAIRSRQGRRRRTPLGRAAQPEEITPAILWLLSPAAAYTTGAVIRVAGGL